MPSLAYAVLAALTLSPLWTGDVRQTLVDTLRRDVGEVESLTVALQPAGESASLGDLGAASVAIRGVDARLIPLAGLVPVPRERTAKGRVARLDLTAEQVRLDTLQASALRFVAEDVRYDLLAAARGELRVTSLGRQELTVLLRDGDLDTHAKVTYPELSNTRITFEEGKVVARAMVPVFVAAFPVTITGRLAIDEGRTVGLRDATIETGRLELSDALRQSILTRLDPLIDLDTAFHLPVPLRWLSIQVGQGQALIHAEVLTPAVPRVAPDFNPRERYLR